MKKKMTRLLRPGFWTHLVILLLCAGVAAFLEQYYLAVCEAGGALILFLADLFRTRSRKRQIQRYIEDTVKSMDASCYSDAPMPKVIFEPGSGEILWANDAFFALLTTKEPIISRPIAALLPDFPRIALDPEPCSSAPIELPVGGRRYHVFFQQICPKESQDAEAVRAAYFVDMTQYLFVKEEYAKSRPVVSVILIDNYDEFTNNLTDNDISALNVAINNVVLGWTAGRGGLLRKIERNRYLFVFEAAQLQQMIEGKFSLLSEIRKVVNSSGIYATISLGIGKDGASFEEAYSFATLSIEMALSRGGDQAVIKDRYNFSFYGGLGRESTSGSKVKARVMAGSLSELIAQSSHVFIMGHYNADLDSLGAAVGVQAICRKRGKKANIIVDYQQNSVQQLLDLLSPLPEYHDCFLSGESALIMADAKSLLIVVDTNRPDQVQYRPLLGSMSRIAVIDHHRRAADYISQVVLNLHDPAASSAAELVSELLQYAVEPKDVLPIEAMALMSGMVLDTKHFSVRTSGRTFEAAAFLRRLGADPVEVKKLLQSDFASTVARYKIVQKARIYRHEIAISVLEEPVGRVIAAQAADELINISNISASFVLFPADGKINISARSIGEANTQVILEPLGGGGNPATAGAQIANASMDQVVERLLASIDHFYQEQNPSKE